MAPGDDRPGRAVVAASWAGTGAFSVTALADAAGLHRLQVPAVLFALALFAASIPIGLYAVAKAAVRSARDGERITVSGLFLLSGSAPPPVRRALLGAVAASIAVAAATAARQPFGILVPAYPLALAGLWAARHGRYPLIPSPGG
jgi:hypothetical protein